MDMPLDVHAIVSGKNCFWENYATSGPASEPSVWSRHTEGITRAVRRLR